MLVALAFTFCRFGYQPSYAASSIGRLSEVLNEEQHERFRKASDINRLRLIVKWGRDNFHNNAEVLFAEVARDIMLGKSRGFSKRKATLKEIEDICEALILVRSLGKEPVTEQYYPLGPTPIGISEGKYKAHVTALRKMDRYILEERFIPSSPKDVKALLSILLSKRAIRFSNQDNSDLSWDSGPKSIPDPCLYIGDLYKAVEAGLEKQDLTPESPIKQVAEKGRDNAQLEHNSSSSSQKWQVSLSPVVESRESVIYPRRLEKPAQEHKRGNSARSKSLKGASPTTYFPFTPSEEAVSSASIDEAGPPNIDLDNQSKDTGKDRDIREIGRMVMSPTLSSENVPLLSKVKTIDTELISVNEAIIPPEWGNASPLPRQESAQIDVSPNTLVTENLDNTPYRSSISSDNIKSIKKLQGNIFYERESLKNVNRENKTNEKFINLRVLTPRYNKASYYKEGECWGSPRDGAPAEYPVDEERTPPNSVVIVPGSGSVIEVKSQNEEEISPHM